VYVGRFDRTSPDGTAIKGLETKEAVIEQLRNVAAKIPADGRWLVAWGYQPEFYGNSPLTRTDLDPISNGHPFFIENLSMHIYYVNSKALDIAGVTDDTEVAGIVKTAGKPTGEIREIEAALTFVAKLPPLDSDTLVKATRDAGSSPIGSARPLSPISTSAPFQGVTKPIRPLLPIPTFRCGSFSIR
jgi:predicted amidohydrolase YtcJ